MDLEELQAWLDGYVEAWRSNDPVHVGALFTEDARYYTHPFRDPWEGREEIVANWIEHPDPPESWRCEYRALAVNGRTGVARGYTTYLSDEGGVDKQYANIFVVEFDDEGRCREFTEWFMESNPPLRSEE